MKPAPGPWIVCPRPQPQARLRLLCFPYAGGGASAFSTWAQRLPASVEVCAVQLPGRENRLREPLFTQLTPLVETLGEVLAGQFDRPFALFGYSMGAIIAFELARLLRRRGMPAPAHLFAAARIAPQVRDQAPPIHLLERDGFIQKLRDLNGTPEVVFQDQDLQRLVIPILRADFAVNEAYIYTPEPPLGLPISALGGTHDPKVSQASLAEWRAQTSAEFRLRMFPGDHFFLNSAQPALLQAVQDDLTPLLG